MAIGEIKTLLFADGISVAAPNAVGAGYVITDTTGWTGSVTTITYSTSATNVPDARTASWVLKDSTFKQILADIDAPSSTQVRVTVDIALLAGTYYLCGTF